MNEMQGVEIDRKQTEEDKLFLSALQNEAYRKEILEILYQQEEAR